MNWIYRGMKIGITVLYIAITALIITTILPFATGKFTVDLPDEQDLQWSYSNGVASFSAPIGINNGGYYDVDDVVLTVVATNSTGYRLIDSTQFWGKIPSGTSVTETIQLSVDFLELIEDGAYWMLYNPDWLELKISISCKYTFKLIKFRAMYDISQQWDGLIKDIGFGIPELVNESGSHYVTVPYYIDTAELIGGQGSMSIDVFNDSSANPIASSTEQIALGRYYEGSLRLSVDHEVAMDLLVRNQTLTAVIEVNFRDFTVEIVKTIDWVAPDTTVV